VGSFGLLMLVLGVIYTVLIFRYLVLTTLTCTTFYIFSLKICSIDFVFCFFFCSDGANRSSISVADGYCIGGTTSMTKSKNGSSIF
jgi:hypothetical protein